jgi:hypothetical protein
MKIAFLPDDFPWGQLDRFARLLPMSPEWELEPGLSNPSPSLIPEDWLEEFAADDGLDGDLTIDCLDDLTVKLDFAAEEAIEYSAAEPEPPTFTSISHPMSPGVSIPGLAPAHDAPLTGDNLTSEAGPSDLTADNEAVANLVSALDHLNSASHHIGSALEVWKARAASSDLIDDYCESLFEENDAVFHIGMEMASICEEVLDELDARLSSDPAN